MNNDARLIKIRRILVRKLESAPLMNLFIIHIMYASLSITKGINSPGRLIEILTSFYQYMIMVSASHECIYAIPLNRTFKLAYFLSNFCDFSLNQALKTGIAVFDHKVSIFAFYRKIRIKIVLKSMQTIHIRNIAKKCYCCWFCFVNKS